MTKVMKYFITVKDQAKSRNIVLFYFSSFDESWKANKEVVEEAVSGIWYKNEKINLNKKVSFSDIGNIVQKIVLLHLPKRKKT